MKIKLTEILNNMFKTKSARAPQAAVDNIMAAARAKTAKRVSAIKFWRKAFSYRGAFVAGVAAVILAVGIMSFNPSGSVQTDSADVYALQAFDKELDTLESDLEALAYDLRSFDIGI